MVTTNKHLLISESRGDSNRCTSCRGKLDQYDMYASHSSWCTSGIRFLRVVLVCGNPSWVTDRVGQSHWSQENGLLTQSTSYRLTDPWVRTQFLSRANQWSRGKSQTSIDNTLLGLPSLYHRHAIGTFNTCSRVPTPRSLTDIGRGYHIETSE
jgi:hypothetical protein